MFEVFEIYLDTFFLNDVVLYDVILYIEMKIPVFNTQLCRKFTL